MKYLLLCFLTCVAYACGSNSDDYRRLSREANRSNSDNLSSIKQSSLDWNGTDLLTDGRYQVSGIE